MLVWLMWCYCKEFKHPEHCDCVEGKLSTTADESIWQVRMMAKTSSLEMTMNYDWLDLNLMNNYQAVKTLSVFSVSLWLHSVTQQKKACAESGECCAAVLNTAQHPSLAHQIQQSPTNKSHCTATTVESHICRNVHKTQSCTRVFLTSSFHQPPRSWQRGSITIFDQLKQIRWINRKQHSRHCSSCFRTPQQTKLDATYMYWTWHMIHTCTVHCQYMTQRDILMVRPASMDQSCDQIQFWTIAVRILQYPMIQLWRHHTMIIALQYMYIQ